MLRLLIILGGLNTLQRPSSQSTYHWTGHNKFIKPYGNALQRSHCSCSTDFKRIFKGPSFVGWGWLLLNLSAITSLKLKFPSSLGHYLHIVCNQISNCYFQPMNGAKFWFGTANCTYINKTNCMHKMGTELICVSTDFKHTVWQILKEYLWSSS